MKLYACIISTDAKSDRNALLSVAGQFSYTIEFLNDGILFDVSGLQNLVGDANKIAQSILAELKKNSTSGNVAVAETTDAAMLLARNAGAYVDPKSKIQDPKSACHVASPDDFADIPLQNLFIDDDTQRVFGDLGLRTIRDLQQVPKDELIDRYGQQFKKIIDVIEQKGGRLLTANIKESEVSWNYNLDSAVDDFEQLVFILNHGLDKLLGEVARYGFSTEQLDILFKLQDKTERIYEIKTSFPTLDKTFWLKLINLRISLDPPESEIVGIHVTSHFTPPRPAQRGLYAVTRPDPERLLLTVNKLKKLVGEENVGVPMLLDERVNKPFAIDAEAVPEGKEIIGEACNADLCSCGSAASHCGEACLSCGHCGEACLSCGSAASHCGEACLSCGSAASHCGEACLSCGSAASHCGEACLSCGSAASHCGEACLSCGSAASHCGEACLSCGSAASHCGEACLAVAGSKTSSEATPRTGGVAAEKLAALTARQASPQCHAASREKESPYKQASREEESPYKPASREEESPYKPASREKESPYKPASREEESPYKQASREKESPYKPASRERSLFTATHWDSEIQNPKSKIQNPVIAFSYFNPPIPAQVLVREKKLVFLRTQFFNGHVTKFSGVWKANSKWWDSAWKAQEWDVEIEGHGVYRLCRVGKDWFLAGEYD